MANSLPRLYLDTSVPSAYYNDRQRERQLLTQRIWHEKLPDYHLVISNITIRELGATKNLKKKKKLAKLIRGMQVYVMSPVAKILADEYLKNLTMTKTIPFTLRAQRFQVVNFSSVGISRIWQMIAAG